MFMLLSNNNMNIFILSWILEQCAKDHCDKHVVKMILETTQLLSTTHHIVNPDQAMKWYNENLIYKKTHQNHPSAIWTRECKENYIWLCHLGLALCNEYAYRYDKKPEDHSCHSKLVFLINNIPNLPSNNDVITLPKLAMPDQYKTNDPVYSYRQYYLNDKERMLVWRKRGPPSWVPNPSRHTHYKSEINRYTKQLEKLNTLVRKTPEHITKIEQLQLEIKRLEDEYNSIK